MTIASLPLFVLIVAGLRGDAATTLRSIYRVGWLGALRALLFAAPLWIPLQWLHGMNHQWAFGAADPQVWGLMAFDSVVVGLMAVMAGTAIHHGCVPPKRERTTELAVEATG